MKSFTICRAFLPNRFGTRCWSRSLRKRKSARRFDADDVSREAWRSLAEEPLGSAIERYLRNDLVRGLVFTDAKIGVFTHPHDPSLVQNRCFLYHLIGNKTGEWKVPVGGMGAVSSRAGTGSAQSRRRNANECRSARTLNVTGKTRSVEFRSRWKTRDGRGAISYW